MMNFIHSSDACTFNFPTFDLTLMNGSVLKCPVLEGSSCPGIHTELQIDTTGEYLSSDEHFSHISSDEKDKEEKELFRDNIFLFYANRSRIYQDGRMFLTPVANGHNLAYFGRSPFLNATLGIVMEWLDNCPDAVQVSHDGLVSLMYHIAGSPLSGMNGCTFIREDGQVFSEEIRPFQPVWQSFADINARYDKAKSRCRKYSLEEVIGMLR